MKSLKSFLEDNQKECEMVRLRLNIGKKLESVKEVTNKYITHRLRE